MTIRVIAPAIEEEVTLPTEISTCEGQYRSPACEIKLEGVMLRGWTSHSQPVRRHLLHEVVLASVRRFVATSVMQSPADGAGASSAPLIVRLSESAYLSPDCLPRPAEKGRLKFEQRHFLRTSHPLLGAVKFERRFRFSPSVANDVHVSSELVAVVSKPIRGAAGIDARATVAMLDDFALVASVAGRHRIKLRGWKIETAHQFEEAFINPLESGAGLPKLDDDDVLIQRDKAGAFLRRCSKRWQSFSGAELRRLRYACYALAPTSDLTVEGSFLAMFASLEGLASVFVSRQGGEFVYGQRQTWTAIKKTLRSAIDSIEVDDAHFNPGAIKRNLPALERVPLSERTTIALRAVGAWTDVLWPLFDTTAPALASIRNLLAHGTHLDAHKLGAVLVAREHLRVILERTLCCALGWPLEDTSVSNGILLGQSRRFAREIASARAVLADIELDPSARASLPIQLD